MAVTTATRVAAAARGTRRPLPNAAAPYTQTGPGHGD